MSGEGVASDTGRLETFADGVMAIAITLLVLDLRVPSAREGLGAQLRHQWPSYVGFMVSFLTIGIMWVNHHHMFKLIERTTHAFLMLNVLFLMPICFLPFPTSLVAQNFHDPSARKLPAVVYGLTMVVIAIMFNVVWRYAARGHRLLVDGVDDDALAKINRSYASGPATYALFTLVAFISPLASLAGYAALAAYWLMPGSGVRVEAALRAP
jgi:uncharacterized membrane protein